MERLAYDAENIQHVLPWLKNTEEIINVLRKIPIHQSHLRIPLSLSYFLQLRDRNEDNYEKNIENDTNQIVILLPDIPRSAILKRLKELGNISNRREIVVKQLLSTRSELKETLLELNTVAAKKRHQDNNENHISIKIRRVNGSLKAFSDYKDMNPSIQIENTPTTSKESSKNLENQITKVNLETAVDGHPVTKFQPLISSGKNHTVTSSSSRSTDDPVLTPVFQKNCAQGEILHSKVSIAKDSNVFNAIKYFEEICTKSAKDIELIYKKENIPANNVPSIQTLNYVPNQSMENVIDLTDADSELLESNRDFNVFRINCENPMAVNADVKANSKSLKKEKLLIHPAKLILKNNERLETEFFPALPKPVLLENGEKSDLLDNSLLKNTKSPEENFEKKLIVNENLVFRVMEMFPEAKSDYIRKVCAGKSWEQLDDIVTVILSNESYPKRSPIAKSTEKEISIDEQVEFMQELLPEADPTYLRMKCEKIGNNEEELNQFIIQARENPDYPTMKEYLRKQKLTAQAKQYTTEFNVKNFVELFPDPEKTFRNPQRKYTTDLFAEYYITKFFQNRYDKLPIKLIRSILFKNENRILPSDDEMQRNIEENNVMKSRRKPTVVTDTIQNISVLQELAYITHKEEITKYIQEIKSREIKDRELAKANGLFNTCQCCFDEEVMPKDTFECPNECKFCRNCIQTSCEVALGDGKTSFMCMNNCNEEFTLSMLQKALQPKLFSKLAQKKSLAEIQAAGIKELESCPFCDFATIPNPTDKIFRCLNSDCMKESCRQCKEENHIPYRCDEVEKDEEVKARVFVEDQMTKALLRECWNCGKSFFKEEGCNKMTCTCKASMCYICKKPVTDYKHFNGIGGDQHHLCPLYSDTLELNKQNVTKAAEAAKTQVIKKLKIDPAADIQKHYNDRKKKLPKEPYLAQLQAVQNVGNNPVVQVNVNRNVHQYFNIINNQVMQLPPPRIQRQEERPGTPVVENPPWN